MQKPQQPLCPLAFSITAQKNSQCLITFQICSRIRSFTSRLSQWSVRITYYIMLGLFSICSEFGTKCSKCYRKIQATDWVRRARENVYHLACFACDSCQRQLSTGEEFALSGDQLLCLRHYTSLVEGDTDKGSSTY